MLSHIPFPSSIDRKPGCINHNVTRLTIGGQRDRDPECPLSPTPCAIVRHRQVEPPQTPHRRHETLGSSQAEALHAFHNQGTVTGGLGGDSWCTTSTASLGVSPSRSCGFVNPAGHPTSVDQSLMVGTPVTNTVSAGVGGGGPSPWSPPPPSLANDATTSLNVRR